MKTKLHNHLCHLSYGNYFLLNNYLYQSDEITTIVFDEKYMDDFLEFQEIEDSLTNMFKKSNQYGKNYPMTVNNHAYLKWEWTEMKEK